MSNEGIAIWLSAGSMAIALGALAWTILRDLTKRPALTLTYATSKRDSNRPMVEARLINHGPGTTIICKPLVKLPLKSWTPWRREMLMVLPTIGIHTSNNEQLPIELKEGESVTILLPAEVVRTIRGRYGFEDTFKRRVFCDRSMAADVETSLSLDERMRDNPDEIPF